MKKHPKYSPKERVYQILTKSNHFWALYATSKVLAQFGPKIVPSPKNKNEKKKNEKTPQVFTQISAKSNHSWALLDAQSFRTDRHTNIVRF